MSTYTTRATFSASRATEGSVTGEAVSKDWEVGKAAGLSISPEVWAIRLASADPVDLEVYADYRLRQVL